MSDTIAIVTGGLGGLGRAMARIVATGLPRQRCRAYRRRYHRNAGPGRRHGGSLLPLVADLRETAECDRVFAESRRRFRSPYLVNNAGLTFTFTTTCFRREQPQRFWECSDDIIQAVMDTTTSQPTRWRGAQCL